MEYFNNIGFFKNVDWIQLTGWTAASLTLLAFSMRTIIVIRSIALLSNIFFITYGFYASIYPVLVLHIALIVMNVMRLLQIRSDINRVKKHQNAADWAVALTPYMKKESVKKGSLLFTKGDVPDKVYLIVKGHVWLPEIGKRIGSGELFGEIGFLTDAKQRTLTAICDTDCHLLSASEEAFTKAYYQSPALGMSILKLLAARLNDLTIVHSNDSK